VSAVTVVWLGSLIDRITLQKYVIIVAVGLTLATALLSQAYNIIVLTIGLYMLRLFGQALLPHAGSTTMARAFDRHRGKALSIASSGFPAGEIILPILAVSSIALIGWRWTYLSISIFIIFILLPVLLWLIRFSHLSQYNPKTESLDPSNDEKKIEGTQQKKIGVRHALLKDYRYWLALPGLMAGPFVATGIFIHQDFIVASQGWTATLLATSFIVYGVVHWASSLVSGVLVDRFSAVKLLPFFLIPLFIALIFVAFIPGWWVVIIMMAFMGVTIGLSPPITGSLWPEIYGSANIGTIRSVNIAIMVFSTSLSPVLFGFLIDFKVPLSVILGGCAVYVLLSSALLIFSYFLHPEKHAIAFQ